MLDKEKKDKMQLNNKMYLYLTVYNNACQCVAAFFVVLAKEQKAKTKEKDRHAKVRKREGKKLHCRHSPGSEKKYWE